MIIDFEKEDPSEALLTPDICIIGAGIAGLVMAREFLKMNHRVTVLESGGLQFEEATQALYDAQNVGAPYLGALMGRFRVFGGSSTRWGAQLLPFNVEDFQDREWIQDSKWPFGMAELAPYYLRALPIMGTNVLPHEGELLSPFRPGKQFQLNPEIFKVRYSKFAPLGRRNLGKTLYQDLKKSTHIQLLLHANVVEIGMNLSGTKAEKVSLKTLSGKSADVHPTVLIVASGTLETTRILLASNRVSPKGIGNQNDLVGRYLQDHVSCRGATLIPKNVMQFENTVSSFFVKGTRHFPRFELTHPAQNKNNLLNVFGHIGFNYPADSAVNTLREWIRALQRKECPNVTWSKIYAIFKEMGYILRVAYRILSKKRYPFMKNAIFHLQVDTEQAPNPDSRLTLSNENDRLGIPKLQIHWALTPKEHASIQWFVKTFQQEWKNLDLGEIQINPKLLGTQEEWLENLTDAYHPAGTTRMHLDPSAGVVDENLKIHGVSNLYIASCSVFPASAGANPTYTLMALAIRLSDHLKQKLHHAL